MQHSDSVTPTSAAGFFEPTIWSTVLKAKGSIEADRQAAMERLFTRYRQPILRHIHASLSTTQRTPEQVEDLTQEFIHQCLRLDFLKNVSPDQGRFRTFIKACIKNFLRDQHMQATADKRGRGQAPISLEATDEAGKPLVEPPGTEPTPDQLMDRQWALSILDHALETLERECAAARRGDLFGALKGHLGQGPELGTAKQLGPLLGMSEGAVHTAMSRMRQRLGELISAEVRQTVGTQEDWRDELGYLLELFG